MSSRSRSDGVDRSRKRKSARSGDYDGRAQLLDAAIESILDVGFYRSSTNEIVRRADVSWGALQYHFGTREALLVAVVHRLDQAFAEDVQRTTLEGDTRAARLASLHEFFTRQYGSPTYLVWLQIVLNLQHDPNTSIDVNAEIMQNAVETETRVRALLREALGGEPSPRDVDALFHSLRGFALSQQLSRALPITNGGDADLATSRFLAQLADSLGHADTERA